MREHERTKIYFDLQMFDIICVIPKTGQLHWLNLKKKNSLIRLPWQVMNFICIHVNTNATAALNTFLSTKIYRTAALMNELSSV